METIWAKNLSELSEVIKSKCHVSCKLQDPVLIELVLGTWIMWASPPMIVHVCAAVQSAKEQCEE